MAAKKASSRKKVARKASTKRSPSRKKKAAAKSGASKKRSTKKAVSKKKVNKKKATSKKKPAARKKVSKKKAASKKKPAARKKASKKKATSKKKPAARKKVSKKKVASKKKPAASKKVSKKKTVSKKKPAPSKTVSKKKPPRGKQAVAGKSVSGKTSGRAVMASRRTSGADDSGLIHGIQPYQRERHEDYMNEEQLEHFRQILLAWKRELMEEVDRTVHHMQDEASNFPDPNDRATQESEFGLELRTRDRERKLLKKIEQALMRIDDGTYGYCEETGEEIGVKRLEARPVATLCVEAQERRELAERQYRDRDDQYR